MPVTLENGKGCSVIHLEGAIGIADARGLKDLLLQVLRQENEVRVSLERATDLDVTAVQLLWAVEREARLVGVPLMLIGVAPDEISAALADVGFDKCCVSENK